MTVVQGVAIVVDRDPPAIYIDFEMTRVDSSQVCAPTRVMVRMPESRIF